RSLPEDYDSTMKPRVCPLNTRRMEVQSPAIAPTVPSAPPANLARGSGLQYASAAPTPVHQFFSLHLAHCKRTDARRGAGEDDGPRLQAEVPGNVLDQRQDRVEHVAAVAVLAQLAVDAQTNADGGQVRYGARRHERRQHAGAIERLGQL